MREAVRRAVTCSALSLTLILLPAVGASRLVLLLVGSLLEEDDDLFESPESERDVTGAARLDAAVVVVRLLNPIGFLVRAVVVRAGLPGLIDVVRSGGVGGRSPLSFLIAFLSLFGLSVGEPDFRTESLGNRESSDVGVLADKLSSSSADLHSKLANSLFWTRLSMLLAKLGSSEASLLLLLLVSFRGIVGVPGGSSESRVLLIEVR